jgi:hypothetical protein
MQTKQAQELKSSCSLPKDNNKKNVVKKLQLLM